MKKQAAKNKRGDVAVNRKASFDIAVEETLEAGVILTGEEVKSVRADRIQLTGSYVKLMYGKRGSDRLPDPVIIGLHLSQSSDPQRVRKLLLHAREVRMLEQELSAKGKTAVPLSAYFSRGWLKIKIGVGSGRKKYDKRELIKRRDLDREQGAELKQRGQRHAR